MPSKGRGLKEQGHNALFLKGNPGTTALWRTLEIVPEPKRTHLGACSAHVQFVSYVWVGATALLDLMFSSTTFKESPCTLDCQEEIILELLGLCQGCRNSDTIFYFCLRSQRLFIIYDINECVWSIFFTFI